MTALKAVPPSGHLDTLGRAWYGGLLNERLQEGTPDERQSKVKVENEWEEQEVGREPHPAALTPECPPPQSLLFPLGLKAFLLEQG